MAFDPFTKDFHEPTMNHIQRQALLYSFANIYSLSLLSGMGIHADLLGDVHDRFHSWLDEEHFEEDRDAIDFDYKFFPLRAVYAKGVPKSINYAMDIPLDDKNFQWDHGSFKQTISPQDQALLISGEVQFAKYLYHHSLSEGKERSTLREKYVGLLLLDSAVEQGKFCYETLRNPKGFFIEKKNKSKIGSELILEGKDSEAELLDQVYMMAAFSWLSDALRDAVHYPNYYDHEKAAFFHEASYEILNRILEYQQQFYEMKTRDLVTVIPLVVDTCVNLGQLDTVKEFIVLLCAELTSRELDNGKLSTQRFTEKESSLSTYGRAMKALSLGYQHTQYNHFLDSAKKIYQQLNHQWDGQIGLFALNKKKKIRYTAKDVGAILSGLNSLLAVEKQSDSMDLLKKQLCTFFNSAINISGLQIASPYIADIPNMMRSKYIEYLDPNLYFHEENSCVLLKEFKISPKKEKIYLDVNRYSSNYALYTSLEIFSLVDPPPIENISSLDLDPQDFLHEAVEEEELAEIIGDKLELNEENIEVIELFEE